ncbi:CdaR family protein [Virgibacillus halodenitrificans]|nr:CdaR family protein [Virgibacillus halodenitrificans]
MMDNWFRSKWFVRVISLAFAILFYVFVYVDANNSTNSDSTFPGKTQEMQTLNDVPVEIKIDEDDYVVSGVPEYVNVSLEGSLGVLTPLIKQRNFSAFVDLRGLDAGEHIVEVEHNISADLNVYIEPKTVEVTIEKKATAEFPINVDFINTDQLTEGYELGKYEIEPSTVSITSSQSVIDQIGIVKVYVDVKDIDKSINNREVPINVYDTQGNELNVNVQPENAVVSVDIDNPSKKVPVSVETTGELPEGYSLTSISPSVEEVEVFGTSNVLKDIKEISTNEIDLSDIEESGKIEAELSLPEGTMVPNNKIEVSVEVEKPTTITNVPIDVEDLEEGLEISFIEPDDAKMDISVVGKETDVKELSAEDFQVTISAADLEPGEHEVPVKLEGPDGLKTTGEFEKVKINIKE